VEIIIGGDLVPTKSNRKHFVEGNAQELLGTELHDRMQCANCRVFNLEVPLTDKVSPINKCGPNLIAPTDTIVGIKKIPADLLILANNHILDQDEQGFLSTIKVLQDNNIAYVGAGMDVEEASKPFVLGEQGIKVGFYACAEHEFTIATKNTAGANPFDALTSFNHIKNLKEQCDFVIVLYHGGKEQYRFPSPNLQKTCRGFVDSGADLIVCQHSHCIGAYELYNGSTIVYGQGNFIFDDSDNEYWQTSLLISLIIERNEYEVKYIPIVKQGNKIRMADQQESDEIMKAFHHRSVQIQDINFIEKEYKIFATSMFSNYLSILHGRNVFFRVLNKLSKHQYVKKLYSKQSLTVIQNVIECEAHRELLLAGLKSTLKELERMEGQ